jgi:hypothetical protein
VVYLVPSDRAVRQDYSHRLRFAIRNLQIWYRNELADGTTFSLNKPIVEVVPTPHVAPWYSTNPVGSLSSLWFFFNVIGEAFALTGGQFFDPANIWVFYIDSDPACGQLVGATSGVAVLPANDLRGLAGEQTFRRARPTHPTRPASAVGSAAWAMSSVTPSACHTHQHARMLTLLLRVRVTPCCGWATLRIPRRSSWTRTRRF